MQAIPQQEPKQPSVLKEFQAMDSKPAVHISAAAGALASSQEPLSCAAEAEASPNAPPSSTAGHQQSGSAPDTLPGGEAHKVIQAAEPAHAPQVSGVIVVQVPAGSSAPEADAVSCSSSPDSMDSVHILKPLTPAQSSEHSPGSSVEEHRQTSQARAAAGRHDRLSAANGAEEKSEQAQQLSCEVCNISTTSAELLQQHLQGRRHLKSLAAADSDGRCCTPLNECPLPNHTIHCDDMRALRLLPRAHAAGTIQSYKPPSKGIRLLSLAFAWR